MFIKVVKTSHFAFVKIKKMYQKTYMKSIRSLGWGIMSLSGWGTDLQKRKILKIPRGVPGWGMVTSEILNHALHGKNYVIHGQSFY